MMYLKLSVAGHLLIFIARTKGHFWSYRPSNILMAAVLGTQTVATIIAVFGLLIPPIGWNLAVMVWIYVIMVFLIIDQLKVRYYKFFDEGFQFIESRLKRLRPSKKI